MRQKVYISFFLVFLVNIALGQETLNLSHGPVVSHSAFEAKNFNKLHDNNVNRLLMSNPYTNDALAEEVNEKLIKHLTVLKKIKNKKSTQAYLKSVYFRSHAKFLHRYTEFSTFSDIFDKKGAYDCVTGTAFLALVYNKLGYETVIKETTFHMYLLIKAQSQLFLVESTDPLNGFVSDPKEILQRIRSYENIDNDKGYQFKQSVSNNIELEHLVALQYYNMAISQYNTGKYQKAYINIIKAADLYDSQRVNEIRELIYTDLTALAKK